MKDLLLNSLMRNITRYCNYDEIKLKEIRYGLASLYLQLTKMIVIFLLSYILGNFKTLLMLMGFYSILRLTACGVHAKKSIHCWIASLLIFIIIPIFCETIIINNNIKFITSIICTLLIGIYAPADTEKRPLINKNKRTIFKIISLIISIIYIVMIFTIKNNTLINCILFALILEVLVILPLTYKVFGVEYNNYKKYKRKE